MLLLPLAKEVSVVSVHQSVILSTERGIPYDHTDDALNLTVQPQPWISLDMGPHCTGTRLARAPLDMKPDCVGTLPAPPFWTLELTVLGPHCRC